MTQKKNTGKPRNNTTTLKIEKEFYDEISVMSERYGMGRKPFIEKLCIQIADGKYDDMLRDQDRSKSVTIDHDIMLAAKNHLRGKLNTVTSTLRDIIESQCEVWK